MDTQFWQSFERQVVDGKYHLQCRLGNGAFGGVFLAHEMIGGQAIGQVAIKLILPISSNQAAQLGELIAMRNLNHPHVVRGLAAGECSLNNISLLYLVMDVAEGTLEQRLNAGSVSTTEAKEIVRSIAEGLQFLHSKNMVHRDLKPGNVLCIDGKWQLADFGLIRAFGSDTAAYTQNIAGTPYFMPPESFKGEMSPAWDVWSLGVLVVVTITRQYPFTGASPHDVANAILTQEPRIASPLPAPLDTIVQGCLIKDRRSRWTAQQVLSQLNANAATSAPTRMPPVPMPRPVSQPQTARTLPALPSLARPQNSSGIGIWVALAGIVAVVAFAWNAIAHNGPPASVHYFNSATATPKPSAVHHSHQSAHHSGGYPKATRLASARLHEQPSHHTVTPAAYYSHNSSPAAPSHTDRVAGHTVTIHHGVAYAPYHHFSHTVAYRPHSARASLGDLHSDSSIGSGSQNNDSGNTSSSSNDISGGLH